MPTAANPPKCTECGSDDTTLIETTPEGTEIWECNDCNESFEVLGDEEEE